MTGGQTLAWPLTLATANRCSALKTILRSRAFSETHDFMAQMNYLWIPRQQNRIKESLSIVQQQIYIFWIAKTNSTTNLEREKYESIQLENEQRKNLAKISQKLYFLNKKWKEDKNLFFNMFLLKIFENKHILVIKKPKYINPCISRSLFYLLLIFTFPLCWLWFLVLT